MNARRIDLAAWPFPVGTPVTVRRDDGSTVQTRTRSMASERGGSRVIWLEGMPSCYLLERVTRREVKP